MSVENINLNFINKSADTNNSRIVIYQQNVAVDFDELAVAWRVTQNVGQLDNHRFVYPILFDMSARDSYGSYTPQITADNGNTYEMIKDGSGDILRLASNTAASPNEVLAQNNLPQGAIDICICRDGKLLAQKDRHRAMPKGRVPISAASLYRRCLWGSGRGRVELCPAQPDQRPDQPFWYQ
ncbi:hypothetical protein [Tateyamaria sp.]|uniref:hypothetical protein n=1 Tax=Tateyamaria sp. TaxID=1929288 RepID=UPI003B21FCE7